MIGALQGKTRQIRWIAVLSVYLIFIAFSCKAWGAAGYVNITSPNPSEVFELSPNGSFTLTGTYAVTADDSPTGDINYTSICGGQAYLSPCVKIPFQPTCIRADLKIKIDGIGMERILRVDQVSSGPQHFSIAVKLDDGMYRTRLGWHSPLPPAEVHTLTVYLDDVYELQCKRGSGGASFHPGSFASGSIQFKVVEDSASLSVVKEKNFGDQRCGSHTSTGNPINVATGNKYQKEKDFTAGSTPMALEFARHYNSQSEVSHTLGYGWSHTYDRYLSFKSSKIIVWREDGRAIYYSASTLRPESGAKERLSRNTEGTYVLILKDGITETYDSAGRLISIRDLNGNSQTLTYSNGELSTVTDPFGRIIRFEYDTSGRLVQLTDPAGNIYQYAYDTNNNLAGVTYQNGSRKQYHYEDENDVHNLTGITDEKGVRYANFAYDEQDRAILSTHAGGADETNVTYGTAGGGSGELQELIEEMVRLLPLMDDTRECNELDPYSRESMNWIHNTFMAHMNWALYYGRNICGADSYYSSVDDINSDTEYEIESALESAFQFDECRPNRAAADRFLKLLYEAIQLEAGLCGGQVVKATDGSGNSTSFTVQAKGGIGIATEVVGTGCSGCGSSAAKKYTYDDNLNVSSITDGNGITAAFTYDSEGNMLSQTEAVGTEDERVTTYTYVPGLHKIASVTQESIQAGESKVTTFSYDGRGNLVERIETGYSGGTFFSHTTTYQYNAYGQIIQIDGPRDDVSDVTLLGYDDKGNLTTVTKGGTLTTTFEEYSSQGGPGRITDPNGVVSLLSYDTRNRLRSFTNPTGTTSYTYDDAGNLTSVELPNGNQLFYTYDEADRLIQVADRLGNTIVYSYDTSGNRTAEQVYDPIGTLTRALNYEYDSFNRLAKLIYPDGAEQMFAYDENGNRTSLTGANGNTTSYIYDSLNRIRQVIQPGEVTTIYTYDVADNLRSVTDGKDSLTSYAYDDAGRLIETVYADTGTTRYTYDKAGNLTSNTDANSVTVTYTYDSLSRLTKIGYPNDTDVIYTYDAGEYAKGRLTGMTDGSGSYAYTYDALGNLIREEKTIQAVNYVTEYSYDAAGLLTSITYPDGRIVTYELDEAGRVALVSTSKGGETKTLATGVSYLPFGPLKNLTHGNGILLAQNYDQRGQLIELQAGSVLDLTHGHDDIGNITAITNYLDDNSSQSFDYDDLNRLRGATGMYGTINYGYDTVGNRLEKIVNSQPETYEYDPGTNHLRAIDISGGNSENFAYDPNGNITVMGDKQFFYGENNRMIQALSGGSVVGEYAYNGRGQRTIKSTAEATTIYHYDLQGHLIAETDQNGKTLRAYFYVGDSLLAVMDGHGGGDSLRKVVEGVVQEVEGLLNDGQDKRVRWRLKRILYHLNHALQDRKGSLWLDGSHLVSKPRGGKAFRHLRWAIRQFDHPVWSKLAPDLEPVLEELAGDLLEVAATLARTCYEEAEAGAGDDARWLVLWLLNRAEWELERGEDLLNTNPTAGKKFAFHSKTKAVNYFQWAWRYSQLVMRLAGLNPSLGPSEEEVIAFVHTDHLGTPVKLTDENGTVVWSADYYPFGEAIVNEDPDGDGQEVTLNFRFPGQYYDSETGLQYNYHRYYDPGTGRYLTPDPIGLLGGINLYGYAQNNPTNFIDPYGLIRWRTVGKGVASVVFGTVAVVGGATAASTPTGIGQVLGVASVLAGSSSISFGVSQIIVGFTDNEIAFMGIKEAIIQGTTSGLTQKTLLGANELLDMLPGVASGRLKVDPSKLREVLSIIKYGLSIGKSIDKIQQELEESGFLESTDCN